MTCKRTGVLVAAAILVSTMASGAQTAVYLVEGRGSALFDQFDVDGYSLAAVPGRHGVVLTVRASTPSVSRTKFPAGKPDPYLPAAPDRDRLVRELTGGARLESAAVEAVVSWISGNVRYDPDRTLGQDPSSVFATRRAFCVGFAELTVDLLRRAGIRAATVQGVLILPASEPGYDRDLSGEFHRWVEVFYPDCGWRFVDPASSRNVGARYVPFAKRSWTRPEDLRLTEISTEGTE
jgi:transglutaminase-like putative cysteine protease